MTSFIKLRTLAIVFLSIFIVAPALAQYSNTDDSLGLPGDNLDLYATLTLFQDSKTIEDFEEELNKEDTGINNLDLDLVCELTWFRLEGKMILACDECKKEAEETK